MNGFGGSFRYRTYVCDPDAVLSMALAAGASFALVENILYALQGAAALTRNLLPFPMHCLCQMIMGVCVLVVGFLYLIFFRYVSAHSSSFFLFF